MPLLLIGQGSRGEQDWVTGSTTQTTSGQRRRSAFLFKPILNTVNSLKMSRQTDIWCDEPSVHWSSYILKLRLGEGLWVRGGVWVEGQRSGVSSVISPSLPLEVVERTSSDPFLRSLYLLDCWISDNDNNDTSGHTHLNTHSLKHTRDRSHTHTCARSHSHTHTHALAHSHTRSHTRSHTHTLSLVPVCDSAWTRSQDFSVWIKTHRSVINIITSHTHTHTHTSQYRCWTTERLLTLLWSFKGLLTDTQCLILLQERQRQTYLHTRSS